MSRCFKSRIRPAEAWSVSFALEHDVVVGADGANARAEIPRERVPSQMPVDDEELLGRGHTELHDLCAERRAPCRARGVTHPRAGVTAV